MSLSEKQLLKRLPSEDVIERDLALNYFDWFIRRYWDTFIAEPLVWNWHMSVLCKELQMLAESVFAREPKPYDLIINIPPGTTKSTIVTIMFPVWCWVRDSDPEQRKTEKVYDLSTDTLKFISGSYNAALSMEHALKSRDIIRSDKFKQDFPYIQLRPDKDAKSHYENTSGGTRFATSVGGLVTGFHAHFLLIDDPLNPKQALATTRAEVNAANDWLDRTMSSRKVDKAITPTVLIMQRLCQGDPTDHMIEKQSKDKKIRHICLPDKLPNEVKPDEYKKYYEENGGYLDPNRLSETVLREAKVDLGGIAYAGQFEQRPAPEGGSMFAVNNIKIMDVMPSSNQIVQIARYWDKAGTKDAGARSAGVKMAKLRNNTAIIMDVTKGQWSYAAREARIKTTAMMDGVECHVWTEQEPGSGGKESAERTVTMLSGYTARKEPVTGSKESRVEPFSAAVEAGNVYLLRGPWNKEYLDELEMAPNGKFKDQWDASGGVYNKLFGATKRAGVWGRR